MVATVVNLTSASSTVHYFRLDGYGRGRGAPTDDVGDYYARKDDEHRKSSHWRGSGAALLGLQGHVETGEFRRVLEGRVPGTEVQLATSRTIGSNARIGARSSAERRATSPVR